MCKDISCVSSIIKQWDLILGIYYEIKFLYMCVKHMLADSMSNILKTM